MATVHLFKYVELDNTSFAIRTGYLGVTRYNKNCIIRIIYLMT